MTTITVQLEVDGPITEMDVAALVKTEGVIDNDVEFTTWVEYRLASDPCGRYVHRSAHVQLKQPAAFASGDIGKF